MKVRFYKLMKNHRYLGMHKIEGIVEFGFYFYNLLFVFKEESF